MGSEAQFDATPEFAAAFRHLMLQVLAQEAETTKKVLAAVPDATRDYRPDSKSRSAWELAWHIAADVWFLEGIANLQFEVNPDLSHSNPARTSHELAEWYATRFAAALAKVRSMTIERLLTPVALGGVAAKKGLRLPGFLYLMFFNQHTVHHRGQLAAYLRPMGAKVPGIYGGSADEPFTGS